MPKFMMIYKGEATDTDDMTEDQARAVFAKWAAWMERVGTALADVGNPFGPGISIVDDGTTGETVGLTGYSIVEAADLEKAAALTEGHPYLSDGEGAYAIDVFELMPVPLEE